MTIQTSNPIGLDGVPAAATALSHVDGDRGELIVAGSRVGDLALSTSFETLAARLWSLASATTRDASAIRDGLGMARMRAFVRLAPLFDQLAGHAPKDAFRIGAAALGSEDGLAEEVALTGGMAVLAGAIVRIGASEEPVAPDPGMGHAADLLRMMRGEPGSDEDARALDAYLVTVADHGMNASTFTARVVASTGADMTMAVTAAYCALTGPLHGGAPEPVLDMLDDIGTRDRIAPWIDAALARKERIMGFGHRVYRGRDPRAEVLARAVALLGRDAAGEGFAAEVEAYARDALKRAKPDRPLDTNVEFYTAILLDALAVPRSAFTLIFAAARCAGWTAHAIEQQRNGRLLRPASIYTGSMPAK